MSPRRRYFGKARDAQSRLVRIAAATPQAQPDEWSDDVTPDLLEVQTEVPRRRGVPFVLTPRYRQPLRKSEPGPSWWTLAKPAGFTETAMTRRAAMEQGPMASRVHGRFND